MKIRQWFFRIAGLGVFALGTIFLFAACDSGSSSGSSAKSVELNEERVAAAQKTFETNVPGCQVTNPAMMSAPLAAITAAFQGNQLSNREGMASFPLAGDVQGYCGGTLNITRLHGASDGLKRGHSQKIFDFTDFCTIDESSGVPQQVVINGTFIDHQEGEPGDFGPTVFRRNADTDGKLSIEMPDETLLIELVGLRHEYGNPGTWNPGVPTQESPDELTAKSLSIDYVNNEKNHRLRNIEGYIFRDGSNNLCLDLLSGRSYTSAGNFAEIYTTAPLVLDVNDGRLLSGALVVEGSGADRVEMRPGAAADVFDIQYNDEPLAQGMDCSDHDAEVLELLIKLMAGLDN